MDSNNYKERVQRAIEEFEARQLKKAKGPTRRNAKPEKAVQDEALLWMRMQGWDVEIFEAKATYDPKRGIYRQQAMKSGVVDCLGNTNNGIGVAIEFKAPGRLGTLKDNQREFLERKIDSRCFAVVVDSSYLLQKHWDVWKELIEQKLFCEAAKYLKDSLPMKRKRTNRGGDFGW